MDTDQAYQKILDDNFWAYRDAGFPANDTALFRHHCGQINLVPRLSKEFSLPEYVVSNLLRMAIEEVRLSS